MGGGKVFVLQSSWDTPDTAGSSVLGVFSTDNLEQARQVMQNQASRVMAECHDLSLDSDCSVWDENYIVLAFNDSVMAIDSWVYNWDITELEVDKLCQSSQSQETKSCG